MTTEHAKSKVRAFEVWAYDVWGNARDGYNVNDRCCLDRRVEIRCRATIYNAGTPREFVSYHPTDRQLSAAAGFRRVRWDGQDGTYEASTAHGRPVGQLVEID